MELRCVTCNSDIAMVDGSASFKCPGCGEEEIHRCGRCRKSARTWKCKCGFEGP